jgi:transposase-like protein
VLGLWIQQTEGAKFWLAVMNELKHRGVEDILIAVIDGLKGFPEAIPAVFPETQIQTCIVHLIGNSLSFCNWKQPPPVARELKRIYNAETAEVAAKRLEEFGNSEWGKQLSPIVQSGDVYGNKSSHFSPIRPRSEKLSIRPTPLRVCTCNCARYSKTVEKSSDHLEAGSHSICDPVR